MYPLVFKVVLLTYITVVIYAFFIKFLELRTIKRLQRSGMTSAGYNTALSGEIQNLNKWLLGFSITEFVTNATNLTVGIAAIFALVISSAEIQAAYRPYVNINKIEISNIKKEEFNLNLSLINSGNIPANYVHVISNNFLNGEKIKLSESGDYGFIPPTDEGIIHTLHFNGLEVGKYLDKNNSWEIEIIISYNGIDTSNHTTSAKYRFNSADNSFLIIGGVSR